MIKNFILFNNRHTTKRILAIILSLILTIGLLPLTVSAENFSTPNVDNILNLESTVPSGFSVDKNNPYGKKVGEEFLTVGEDEYLLFQTTNAKSPEPFSRVSIFDGININNTSPDTLNNVSGSKIINSSNIYDIGHRQKEVLGAEYTKEMSYVSAAAYRPFGGIRDNWVAYVGAKLTKDGSYDGKEHVYLYLWVQYLGDMTTSTPQQIGQADFLMGQGSGIDQYKFKNFIQITTGDYDGDGRDSIAVFIPAAKGSVVNIYEYSGNDSFNLINIIEQYHFTFYFDSTDADRRLACSLTTGDFTGNGVEQLAIGTYTNLLFTDSNPKQGATLEMYPALVTIWNQNGQKFGKAGQKSLHTNIGDNKYQMMITSSLAAGDTDNDGKDELIAAGYTATGKFYSQDSTYGTLENIIVDNKNFAYSIMNISDNEIKATPVYTSKFNPATQMAFIKLNGAKPPLAVTTFKVNGDSMAEHVFISGSLYDFSGTNLSVDSYYTYTEFHSFLMQYTVLPFYVETAISGNFVNGQMTGREQVLFSIVLRSDKNLYLYSLGYITGTDYYDDINSGKMNSKPGAMAAALIGGAYDIYPQDPTLKDWGSAIHDRAFIFDGEVGDINLNSRGLNFVLVPVDSDNDGVLTKYRQTTYTYSDPKVEAILQAAPYFNELSNYDAFNNNQTSYSFITGYEKSKTSTDSVSFGCGNSIELDVTLGIAFKVSAQLGYTLDWEKSFEESFETTYTTTFTSTDEDVVIIRRTPLFHYFYDVYNTASGAWIENALHFSIPQKPMYFLLNIEQYNTFVDKYNALMDQGLAANKNNLTADGIYKLNKIDNNILPDNNEGNPANYYKNTSEAGTGALILTDKNASDIPLGHGGGSITLQMDTSSSTTNSITTKHGFSSNISIMTGEGLLGNSIVAGSYVSLDYSHGSGYSKTTSNGISTSGTVTNISSGLNGLSNDLLSLYTFNWNFGKWERNLVQSKLFNNEIVPVIGYFVSSVSKPANAPTNFRVLPDLTNKDGANLTWEPPTLVPENHTLIGYNLYRFTDSNSPQKMNSEPIKETRSMDKALTPGKLYTYYVTAVYQLTDGEQYESIGSNNSSIVGSKIGDSGKDGKSAYELAVENGFKGNVSEWLASLVAKGVSIEKIEKTSSLGNLDTYTIYFTNGNNTTFTVTNGVKGDAGIGIKSIVKTNTAGLIDTYTITLSDNSKQLLTVTNGEKGAEGPQGVPGIKGSDGKTGSDGRNGFDGKNGKDGLDGLNGKDGKDGKDGLNGLNGKDGLNGENGKNGIDGKNGADGTKGVNGIDGKDEMGISSVTIRDDGSLIVTLSDGTSFNAGILKDQNSRDAIYKQGKLLDAIKDEVPNIRNMANVALWLAVLSFIGNILLLLGHLRKFFSRKHE